MSKHVSFKSLRSGEVVSCHLLCCFLHFHVRGQGLDWHW